MKKTKELLKIVIAMALITIALLLGNSMNMEAKAAKQNTVIFHYQRTDGDYTGWNIYHWGPDNGSVKFSAEDSFGKIAVLKFDGDVSEVGFIVRKSTESNEWESKDPDGDRFIKVEYFKDGVAEVWLYSGQPEFDKTCPAGYEPFTGTMEEPTTEPPKDMEIEGDTITVKLHYYRSGGDYKDWNVHYWTGSKAYDGVFDFNGEDEFGKIATYQFPADIDELGFIVRRGEWLEKDYDGDRYIDLSKVKDGVIDLWVISGDKEVYYEKKTIDNSISVKSASFSAVDRIHVTLNTEVNVDKADIEKMFTVKGSSGKTIRVKDVVSTSTNSVSKNIMLILEDDIVLEEKYTVSTSDSNVVDIGYSAIFDTSAFEKKYTYTGSDLGANWTKAKTTFKLWAPTATKVSVKLYKDGVSGSAYSVVAMNRGTQGVWSIDVTGDLNKVYYTYEVDYMGTVKEIVDPYAKTTGVNGIRGMVLNMSSTNPDGWSVDERPFKSNYITDACIYEIHIRDFTIDSSSGVKNKGKYLGIAEKGTKNSTGQATALDYLKELGITHVQVMPIQDFAKSAIDETKNTQYNWGYDVEHFNVPEGSYSTNPNDGEVRVKELKQMIQALHNEGIGVVMDVVYGYTADANNSSFNISVPGYFYRLKEDGSYSTGSGLGNELATERAMVKKYIIDSVLYWAKEYHIDGFRFELMGLMDIETMNEIRTELKKIDPSIIIYGEPWTGGTSTLSENDRVLKKNMTKLVGVAAYSDDIRDGIKGSVFDSTDKGFATGSSRYTERVKSGVVGATYHKEIDYTKVGTDIGKAWTNDPTQVINYVSSHDNLTLWDKINTSNKSDSVNDKIRMNKLAASIIYTSQGTPFMLSGEEIFRTKPKSSGEYDHNSYKSSDAVNSIKWNTLNDANTKDLLNYYKGLIAFRKEHAGLRMRTAKDVQNNLHFLTTGNNQVIAYVINNKLNGEISDSICVIYNASEYAEKVSVPYGTWKICIKNGVAGTSVIEEFTGDEIKVDRMSCLVMVKGMSEAVKETVTIPYFAGKSLEELKGMFNELGLNAIVKYVTSDTVEVGGIVNLSVKEGDSIEKGKEVVIYISKGAAGEEAEDETTIEDETTVEDGTTVEDETTVEDGTTIEDETTVEDNAAAEGETTVNEDTTSSDEKAPSYEFDDDDEEESNIGIIIAIIVGVVAVIAGAVAFIVINKK